MSCINRIVLIGRITRDPELRTTNAGKHLAEFVVAVDKRLKGNDGQPSADFFRCKAWGNTAEFVTTYLSKGRLVGVEGRMESRRFIDKDGNNREVWEVVCDAVQSLDRPRDDQHGQDRDRDAVPAGKAPAADEYDPFADE